VPDVLLTGGSGFIGGALLRRLVAEGRSVRALARSEAAAAIVRAAGAEPVRGDVTDRASLEKAFAGCRVVFHVAGLNATCLRDPDRLDRVNVEGTRAVVAAGASAGVARIIYTSSAAAIGHPSGVVGDEGTPHRGSYLSRYERSKHLAEQMALAESARLGIPLVAVCPSSVQGPGRTTGTARLFIAYLRGRLRIAVRTSFSLVSVDDAVTAHLLAERHGVPGERYLVSGWATTTDEAVETLALVTGVRRRVGYLPGWALKGTAAVAGAAARLARRDATLCPEVARTVLHGHLFDGSRAARELGLRYTPPQTWLAETVAWYREQGLV
jgi:dihydroflavonol-4-reductase